MQSLLPSNKEYYRYNGSLTTEPCYETVTWTVFKTPITISKYQVMAKIETVRLFCYSVFKSRWLLLWQAAIYGALSQRPAMNIMFVIYLVISWRDCICRFHLSVKTNFIDICLQPEHGLIPMSHLQFYRAILSCNIIARQRCSMQLCMSHCNFVTYTRIDQSAFTAFLRQSCTE